jgi:hypothetical protein
MTEQAKPTKLDELNHTYSEMCKQLGDLEYKKRFLLAQMDHVQEQFAKEASNGSGQSAASNDSGSGTK